MSNIINITIRESDMVSIYSEISSIIDNMLNKAFLFNTAAYYAYNYISNAKYDNISKYEYNNCIERWILSVMNSTVSHNPLDLFIENDDLFDINQAYNQKLIDEIIEKTKSSSNVQNFVQNMLLGLKTLIENCKPPHVYLSKSEINKLIKSNNSDRLMQLDSSKSILDKQKHISILKLIYNGIAQNQSQQWSAPLKLYQHLYDTYNLRYEGFASPFNSKLLKIGLDAKYCSLFYEPIDKYYNSIGTFFNTEFPPDSTWYINPPFIVSIFEKVWEKIQNELKKSKNHLIFLNLPAWDDLSIIPEMNNSPWLISKIELRKNTYYYEDPMGKHITARFNSYVFIFSSNPIWTSNSINKKEIVKSFSF
jgi:hypothetical protein